MDDLSKKIKRKKEKKEKENDEEKGLEVRHV